MIIEKNTHTTEKTHPTIETIDRAVSHHEQPEKKKGLFNTNWFGNFTKFNVNLPK